MVIGACKIELFISENSSLKEKRRILKKIIMKVKNTFNVSIAEVGNYDLWQSAQVGFCMVGNDKRFINSSIDTIINFIERVNNAELIHYETEIINVK